MPALPHPRAPWRTPFALTLLCGLLAAPAAQAGRPLSSDDANVNEAGVFQLETWAERTRDERSRFLSSTVGLGHSMDLTLGVNHLEPHSEAVSEFSTVLKWAPADGQFETRLGTLKLGLNAGFVSSAPLAGGWTLSGVTSQALVTLETPHALAFHLNVGPQRDRLTHHTNTLLSGAVAWTPTSRVTAFLEAQGNDRSGPGDGAIRSTGGRYWLVPEKLGLDMAMSRRAGSQATILTFGIGWYGLGF